MCTLDRGRCLVQGAQRLAEDLGLLEQNARATLLAFRAFPTYVALVGHRPPQPDPDLPTYLPTYPRPPAPQPTYLPPSGAPQSQVLCASF